LALEGFENDVIGVSAGFDTYVEDWSACFQKDDFLQIGQAIREAAENRCQGKCFAVLGEDTIRI